MMMGMTRKIRSLVIGEEGCRRCRVIGHEDELDTHDDDEITF